MFTAEAYKLFAMYFYGKMWAKECQVLFAAQKLGCAVVATVFRPDKCDYFVCR